MEEISPPQVRMRLAQSDQPAGEGEQLVLRRGARPVEPEGLVVLAVGVVVAELRSPALVAREQHRDALRQKQGRQQVAFLALA